VKARARGQGRGCGGELQGRQSAGLGAAEGGFGCRTGSEGGTGDWMRRRGSMAACGSRGDGRESVNAFRVQDGVTTDSDIWREYL
jgi:hypothetical protein